MTMERLRCCLEMRGGLSLSDVTISKTNSKSIYLGKKSNAVTGVNLYVGQDANGTDIVYVAGDSTGFVLDVSNPFGTQSMANNILSSLKLRGFRYQAFDSNTFLNPAVEIGDTATVDTDDAIIYSIKTMHSTLMGADVSAPYDEEINNEYQYESKQERTFRRQIGEVRATLSIQADEIAAKVSATGGDNQSFGWSMKTAGMFWYANGSEIMRATKNGLKVTGEIVATSGNIGGATIGNGVLTVENANIGSINGSKVISNTLDGDRIVDYSIGSAKYFSGSVDNSALGAGAVTDGKIFGGTITPGSLSTGINTSLYNADDAHGVAYTSGGYGYISARFITCSGNLYFQNHTCKWITIDGIPVISY